ncbi:MAG: hypothetical protein ON057_000255 [Glomeribacter sp. 1016415]|nr:hypothetical protein [Glomeribacter sp. 1016415]
MQGNGRIDENATALKLNQIALSLGADAYEAEQATQAIIQAATLDTEYPMLPKPSKDGKDQEMKEVMSSLEALINGQ